MNVFEGWEQPRDAKDFLPVNEDVDLFARIEGLTSEETALLAVPGADRDQAHHERLRAVSAELDRIWEHLRDRAHRLSSAHE